MEHASVRGNTRAGGSFWKAFRVREIFFSGSETRPKKKNSKHERIIKSDNIALEWGDVEEGRKKAPPGCDL